MGRFILYLLIALGAAYSIEPIRKRITPPTLRAWEYVTPYVNVVVNPVKKDVAEREEKAIVVRLRDLHNEGRPLPDSGAFQKWLRDAISVGRDPWKNDYWLQMDDATAWVGSNGADGLRGTGDDVISKCGW